MIGTEAEKSRQLGIVDDDRWKILRSKKIYFMLLMFFYLRNFNNLNNNISNSRKTGSMLANFSYATVPYLKR